ncbi:MAG TPA: histone deacetylase family protein [Deltaproteobacteria bacterium]|nr:histone deacetylase family protein [Deltaproteobacteria bacterium]HOM29269.1 histone deacetylase family protein [Deltaproteobacteria bacterium]HPP81275.1 histone deacetylase family protein [Deltaproteobacteria bacterium]
MKVVFHEDFYRHYTSDPAAEPGRLEAVMEAIAGRVELIEPEPAALEDIQAVHTEAHIQHIKRIGLHEIASLAAGGAIKAAVTGMEEPCFALIRPPGHHASANTAWGFCFYNNMAVAIERLRREGKIERAHILDFDLHFGDGTVNILGRKGYVTIHNPESHERASYLKEVEERLAVAEADVFAVSAGFDNHEQDWGGLLATDDYRVMGAMVREAALKRGAGLFAILEGGYNHRVLGSNVLALIEGMELGGQG